MSSEKRLEEILIESHELGIENEVFQIVNKISSENPKINRIDVYETALKLSKKKRNKWFIAQNSFVYFNSRIWFIPCISIWYDKHTFLETGVVRPAFGLQLAWLKWTYGFMIQKGY